MDVPFQQSICSINNNPETACKMCIFGSVFENKRYLHLDPILSDLSFIID